MTTTKNIVILDYQAGNSHSVQNACEKLGVKTIKSADPNVILTASKIIVPGQGAFKNAMENLTQHQLIDPLKTLIQNNIPFLGICLGFQILFESSSEHGLTQGLRILPGTVEPMTSPTLKIPHMGWNQNKHTNHPMYTNIPKTEYFYFVHSYFITKTDPRYITGSCDYTQPFVSSIAKNNVWGTQFHPEKSSDCGLQLLKNFLAL